MFQAKLSMPCIGSTIIRRKKIEDKLRLISNYKFIFLSAPAGYGKTTAVANYLASESIKHAWFSIDESDNDPVVFWRYLTTAISQCLENSNVTNISIDSKLIASNISADLLIQVLEGVHEELVIVLDDYHLIGNRTILESMEYVVKYMPCNIKLILLSRKEPENMLHMLCSRGNAIWLGIEDIAFDEDETGEFFTQKELCLTQKEIKLINNCTEGWAAGMVAASLSIKACSNVSKAISSFSGRNRDIDRMLGEEVFDKWSDDIKEFLIHTSFLNKISGPLCKAVTGNEQSAELLIKLSEYNSFIISLDQQNYWFRYHHLFQEFLLQLLNKEKPELSRSLYCNAGQWYQEKAYYSEAINCYLKAEEYEKAFPLILDMYLTLAQNGEYDKWLKWAESLPQELCESKVMACTDLSWILSMENEFEKAELWADKAQACFDRTKETMVKQEREFLEANIVLAYANISIIRMDPAAVVCLFKKIKDYDMYTPVEIGEMNSGESSLLKTTYGFSGRLEKVLEAYGGIIDDIPKIVGDYSAYFSTVIAECQYQHDDLKSSYKTLVKNIGKIIDFKNPGIIVPCFITLAKLKRAVGDIPGALDIIASGQKVLGKGESVWSYILHVFTASLYLDQKDTENAAKWLAVERMGLYDSLSESRELEYIIFARYLIQTGRSGEALVLLSRLEDFAQSKNRLGSQIEIVCLKAISINMMGNTTDSMIALHRALSLGAPDGYIRIFADENHPMLELLINYKSWARQTGNVQHLEYSMVLTKATKEHLLKLNASLLNEHVNSDSNHFVKESLSERELSVLKLLADEFTNKEIADKLFITVRTVKYYTAKIYEKLGVSTRIEAIVKAKGLGL